MSSCWGNALRFSLFGESRGEAVGAVLDGFPPGLRVDFAALFAQMARRAPGGVQLGVATRRESDAPRFLSGLLDGVTTGAPLCLLIYNEDARPDGRDLSVPRPGHADFPAMTRYDGQADLRGGGHFSGRLTAPLVAAGALCRQLLRTYGVDIAGRLVSVGNAFSEEVFAAEILAAQAAGDSVGGVAECTVRGVPVGWGEPMFGGLEPSIASLVLAIPACKGVEFGDGFALAALRGSQANDAYILDETGAPALETNRCGGILGGLSAGSELVFRAAFKPTPSIALPQKSVDIAAGAVTELTLAGRQDACVAVRALPAVEAACALALTDAMIAAQGNRGISCR